MRAPLLNTDNVIQFAINHQNGTVDPAIAREMHMAIVNTIPDLLNRPRRLFLGKYDEYFQQVEVLIDFSGTWVELQHGCRSAGLLQPNFKSLKVIMSANPTRDRVKPITVFTHPTGAAPDWIKVRCPFRRDI